jgi:hypothetical protein
MSSFFIRDKAIYAKMLLILTLNYKMIVPLGLLMTNHAAK